MSSLHEFNARGREQICVLLVLLLVALLGATSSAQTLTTLYNLQGGSNDGNWPCGGVVGDGNGNLYGSTQFGGPQNAGVVFELNNNNVETVLHIFEGTDGQNPCSALLRLSNGDLYGTTIAGGLGEYGTVFKIRNGALVASYDFQGGLDGQNPFAGLMLNVDGNLYGTTVGGGLGACGGGCGTVFKFDNTGHKTVIHSFIGKDGGNPGAMLIHDARGNIYGTTATGGANQFCPQQGGCGTVFKIDPSGTLTVLYSFTGGTDGWDVQSGPVLDSKGNLYGTTVGGGTFSLGTIYEITAEGSEKVLYSFAGAPDGADPGQISLRGNALYGTTYTGGDANCSTFTGGCGTIFRASLSEGEQVLYRFGGVSDGALPTGPVTFDTAGNLYGTTQEGVKDGCSPFPYGCGTIWKLTLGTSGSVF